MSTVTSCEVGDVNAAFPHATAWFAPLPPGWTFMDVAVRVSPAPGTRGVEVTKSMFREPMTNIVGLGDMVRAGRGNGVSTSVLPSSPALLKKKEGNEQREVYLVSAPSLYLLEVRLNGQPSTSELQVEGEKLLMPMLAA